MSYRYKQGNDIIRNLFIEIDFNTFVSYKEFRTSSEYKNIINIFDDESWYSFQSMFNFSNRGGLIDSEQFHKIFLLLHKDIKETFPNVFIKDDQGKKSCKIVGLIEIIESSHYQNGIELEYYKYYKNKGLYAHNIPLLTKNAESLLDFYKQYKILYGDKNSELEIKQTFIANKKLAYIIFHSLIHYEDLFIVSDKEFLNFSIATNSTLSNNKYASSMLFNISKIIKQIFSDEFIVEVERIKNMYKKNNDIWINEVVRDIIDLLNKTDSDVKISIKAKNMSAPFMTAERKGPMADYHEHDAISGDYGTIGKVKNRGHSNKLIATKQFHYGKDGKKENDV